MPSFSSEHTLSICCILVSGFFTEITQQFHSLRASGVISSHFVRASGSETRAFRKSAGTLWTTPAESDLVMPSLYIRVKGSNCLATKYESRAPQYLREKWMKGPTC